MKVLIFYASFGTGHLRVAETLAQYYRAARPDTEVRTVDIFAYINATLNKIVLRGYMESLQFTPAVYERLYNDAYKTDLVYDFGNIFAKLFSGRLLALIGEFRPDVIIVTHAFAAGIISVAKRTGQITAPVLAVVTDYDVHPFWVHDSLEYYNLPSPLLDLPLLARGIGPDRILSCGIPIAPEFYRRVEPEAARAALGLSNLPTALIMGGGFGLGAVLELLDELLGSPYLAQLLVVAGKNRRLAAQVQDLALRYPGKVFAYGFVTNVAQLMSAADILFTKPGGVTVTEAIALRVPLAIYSALPGQEEKNALFLLNQGLAINIPRLAEINLNLHQFFRNPLRASQMAAACAAALPHPGAEALVQFTFTLAGKH